MKAFSLGLFVSLSASVLFVAVAHADQGRVYLNDGSIITGEIVAYQPGVSVSVQMANGQTIELQAADVQRVEIGNAPAPVQPAQDAPPPPPPAANGAGEAAQGPGGYAPQPQPGYGQQPVYGQQAGYQPARPLGRRPSLAPPFVLLGISVALMGTGGALFATGYCYSCSGVYTGQEIAGMTLMSMGGLLFIASLAIALPIRLGKRRRWARANGMAFRLSPMLDRRRAGLVLGGAF